MTASQERSVPMEVVGLGLCRTGTQSLSDALQLLGYGVTYHMQEVMKQDHLDFWVEKMNDLTASKGAKMPTQAELNQHMGDYRTLCDVPPALFTRELLDAYPDAKLILTTRSCESWMKSVQTSLLSVFGTVARTGTNRMAAMGDAMQGLWDHDFEANGAAFFENHNRIAKEEAAKRGRELLILDVSEPDSWQRLCDFLGKESPAEITEFPNRDFFRTLKEKMANRDPASTGAQDMKMLNDTRAEMEKQREEVKQQAEASAV